MLMNHLKINVDHKLTKSKTFTDYILVKQREDHHIYCLKFLHFQLNSFLQMQNISLKNSMYPHVCKAHTIFHDELKSFFICVSLCLLTLSQKEIQHYRMCWGTLPPAGWNKTPALWSLIQWFTCCSCCYQQVNDCYRLQQRRFLL